MPPHPLFRSSTLMGPNRPFQLRSLGQSLRHQHTQTQTTRTVSISSTPLPSSLHRPFAFGRTPAARNRFSGLAQTQTRSQSSSMPSKDSPAQAYFHKVSPALKGVYCIALNRPASRNAISIQLLRDLAAALDQAENEGSALNVLIFHSSTAGMFCSGADLIERRSMSEHQVHEFLSDMRNVFSRIENLSFPTIAAIDGPAMGGGLELALTCDFRIAARDVTKISFPEVRLGIIPGAGGTQRAPRLIGLTKAKELIFTGRVLTAADAQDLGLVDYISEPSSTAYERALRLAQEMSSSAPLALRAAKAAISRSLEFPLDSALDHERACYEPLLVTRDRVEALDAFREKRAPNFTGQ